jgi:hypothetical protein
MKQIIDSEYVFLVSVFLDKDYKYDDFEQIANKEEMVIHEFGDYWSALEYTKCLELMNEDYIGRFHFAMHKLPIEFSENFTNNKSAKFYPVNLN